jgi:hypothetical protein
MAKKSPSAAAADSFNAMLGDLYTVGDSGDLVPFKGDAGITAAEIRAAKGDSKPYPALASSYLGPEAGVYKACCNLLKQGWTGTSPFSHDITRELAKWLKNSNIPFIVSQKEGEKFVVLADKKALARILKP